MLLAFKHIERSKTTRNCKQHFRLFQTVKLKLGRLMKTDFQIEALIILADGLIIYRVIKCPDFGSANGKFVDNESFELLE